MNPFAHRARSIHGPATDALPVTPDDATDLPMIAIGLFVETGSTVVIDTVAGETRTITVADFSILPLGTNRLCREHLAVQRLLLARIATRKGLRLCRV